MDKLWSAPDGPWHGDGIAIIGMAGRFPAARSVSELWDNLCEGRDCISRFTDEELAREGVDEAIRRHDRFVPAGAVLDDIDLFDADLFAISPREAESMDPQQRFLLEVVQEAFDDAGLDPDRAGSIGVYAGGRLSGYWLRLLRDKQFMHTMGWHQVASGNDKDFLATQVSYRFNLRGPSVNVQAACSTSMLAVALASDALIAGHCDVAIAGGVSIAVPHRIGYLYQPSGIASPDGVCRPFDAGANGSVLGNGVGVVVLKPVGRAIRDRDRIYAVIRATAVNNDGRAKSSFAAPSVEGQRQVIAATLRHSGVASSDIQYVEAHGTATVLGDPIEVTALSRAYGTPPHPAEPCRIGSVKGNLGHLDPAAGIASLIKVAMSLFHSEIPPSIHFERPNPAIDFAGTGFRVATERESWLANGQPRRGAVSSFGIGGTNVHAVLEEAPAVPPRRVATGPELLPLSAASAAALQHGATALATHLEADPDTPLADIAFTLASRRQLSARRWIVADAHHEAVRALRAPARSEVQTLAGREICLMFPGQGSQYAGMGRELYRGEPVFKAAFDDVACSCLPHLDTDLRDFVASDGRGAEDQRRVQQTVFAQPLLFAVEYACAQLWRHWGIEPDIALGHSVGEFVAGCICGVMPMDDAARVVCARGRLMQAAEEGAMLAVSVSETEARALEDDLIRVSALNGPRQQTLSGPVDAIAALERRLANSKVVCHRLRTSHAFHHPSMQAAAAELRPVLETIRLHPPTRPFISTISGTWIRPDQATDPAYWVSGVVEPVRFSAAVQELLQQPDRVLIECGPGTALTALVRSHPGNESAVIGGSMSPSGAMGSDRLAILESLGTAWQSGVSVHWDQFWKDRDARRVTLPRYPFQRKRYWIDGAAAESEPPGEATPSPAPALLPPGPPPPAPSAVAYVPAWQPAPPPVRSQEPACWIVLADSAGLGPALCERLAQAGSAVVAVLAGPGFHRHTEQIIAVGPGSAEDMRRLVDGIESRGRPVRLVSTWSMSRSTGPLTVRRGEEGVQIGFRAPVLLLQALARAGRPAASFHTITSGLFNVSGAEITDPSFAPALGIIRVLPQELAQASARLIDVSWPSNAAEGQLVADLVAAEVASGAQEPVVAYRGGLRLAESFRPVGLPPPDAMLSRLRARGTYIITGGFGGMGGVLASTLAGIGRPQLVLVGRRGIGRGQGDGYSAAASGLVGELERRGATVAAVAADVSDPEQVQRLIQEVRGRFGPVAGLVHAAGVPGGGVLLTRDLDAADAVFMPKVQGTIALLSAVAADRPDFIALCSSFASVSGGVGQADYCGANATLDALAWYGRAAGLPVTSIGWPAWREVGMAASMSLPTELASAKAESLASGISPSEGAQLFASLIAAGYPQVVVPPAANAATAPGGDAAARAAGPAPPASAPPQTAPPLSPAASPTSPAADGELEAILQQRIREIWSAVLGTDPGDKRDNFFELGGQSLMALQIVTRICEQFPITLDLSDLLQRPTIPAFAELVHERLVASIASLPDDRVQALLSARAG